MKQQLLIAATGASGAPLLLRCLQLLQRQDTIETALILSESAKLTISQETAYSPEQVETLADTVYQQEDLSAAPASGSFPTLGMLVVPCSMKTAAGISCGYTENLILRAADVTIKEQRKLVLAVRESPMSAIHLDNLSRLSKIPGVFIMPPVLTFYHRPKSLDEMLDRMAARLLSPFGIVCKEGYTWTGPDNI